MGTIVKKSFREIIKDKKRLRLFLIFVFVLFIFSLFFGGNYGFINMIKLNSEKKNVEKSIDSLKTENLLLEKHNKSLKNDKNAIERIAREKFGMAKKGETVIKFVDKKQYKK